MWTKIITTTLRYIEFDQKDKVLGRLNISASQHTLIKWASDKSNSVAGELFTLAHI